MLLIDDIQFLHKKEQTQEEFFHTFNALYDAQKQIVLTSDRHPKGLATLEDRLVSRFEWGLITDIQPPDLETRVAILRKKARTDRIVLADDDTLMLIASRVPTNIRELEGCLTRVVAYSSITKRPINVDLAREVLKDIPETAATRVTIDIILSAVSESTGVSITEIIGDKRSRPVVDSRHLAMYLARELTDSSLPKIGERFGNRDHTTVLHAVREDHQTHAGRPGDVQPRPAAHHQDQERLTGSDVDPLIPLPHHPVDNRWKTCAQVTRSRWAGLHRSGTTPCRAALLSTCLSQAPRSLILAPCRRADRLSTPSTVSTNTAIFLSKETTSNKRTVVPRSTEEHR